MFNPSLASVGDFPKPNEPPSQVLNEKIDILMSLLEKNKSERNRKDSKCNLDNPV